MKEFTSTMDHESIPVLRDNKIKFYEQLLVDAVDFKYKVSFYKGIQFVFETLILLILMLSMILKSNFISIIYFLFLLKYLVSRSKTRLIIFMAQFISIAFSAQYIMYVMISKYFSVYFMFVCVFLHLFEPQKMRIDILRGSVQF